MMASIAAETMRAVAAQSPAQIAEVARLQALVARQADRIAELEEIVGTSWRAPYGIAMTPTGRQLLGALMKASGGQRADALAVLLWGDRPECDQPDDPRKTLKVHVHNLRRALRPHGVTVETIGFGATLAYRIPRADRAVIEGMRHDA